MSRKALYEPLPTGVAGLDTILRGGLLRGGLYILEGAPGSGKTTLANQIAYSRGGLGDRIVYLTLLSEGHDRLIRYMSNFEFLDRSLIPDRVSYISAFQALRDGGLNGVLALVRETIRGAGADLLVLDGLYVAQERAPSRGDFREFIYELQGEASLHATTMLFITGGAAPEFSPERTLVDGILQLSMKERSAETVRILTVLKFRGVRHLKGPHFVRIDDSGLTVTPRLESLDLDLKATPVLEKLTSGISGLDRICHGGLPARSTTLLIGPSGSGKTTFGLHFLSAATPREPGVFFGAYETIDKIRLKARSLGIDIDGLTACGALHLLWQKPFDTHMDEIAARLIAAAEQTGAHRIFIDGIGAFKQTTFFADRLERFFQALTLRLTEQGATCLVTTELPGFFQPEHLQLDNISGNAEGIILQRFAEYRSRLIRMVSVLKLRDSDFDHTIMPFEISDKGVIVSEPLEDSEHILRGRHPLARVSGA